MRDERLPDSSAASSSRDIAPLEFVSELPVDVPTPAPRPWGFWMTWLWMMPISVAVLGAQTVIVLAYLGVQSMVVAPDGERAPFDQLVENVGSNGLVLSLATLATTVLVTAFLWLPVWLRGMRYRDYLGLDRPTRRQIVACTGLVLVLVVLSDGLTALLGRPIVSEFMIEAHATTGFVPLLWLALMVCAPWGEEIVFRGFLLAPRGSRLTTTVGLVASSLSWAIIHLQYDAFGISTIFATGLLLGAVRLRTGSTTLSVLMHSLMNAIATAELYVWLYLVD